MLHVKGRSPSILHHMKISYLGWLYLSIKRRCERLCVKKKEIGEQDLSIWSWEFRFGMLSCKKSSLSTIMVINKFFCGGISKAPWHGYFLQVSRESYKDGKKIVPSESYKCKKTKLMSKICTFEDENFTSACSR